MVENGRDDKLKRFAIKKIENWVALFFRYSKIETELINGATG